jgi:hypothetical protein
MNSRCDNFENSDEEEMMKYNRKVTKRQIFIYEAYIGRGKRAGSTREDLVTNYEQRIKEEIASAPSSTPA